MAEKEPWSERGKIKREAIQKTSEHNELSKRQGLKQAKSAVQESKQSLKEAKTEHKATVKAKQSTAESREKLHQAKHNLKVDKQAQRAAYNRIGGTKKEKLARGGHRVLGRMGEAAWQGNDTLEDIADARQKIRGIHASLQQSKQLAKASKTVSKGLVKGSYGLVNRGYNLLRGRGFTRTVAGERWEVKAAKRLRAFRHRLKFSKAGKSVRGTGKVLNFLTKPLQVILKNPLSLKAYIVGFFLILFFAIFLGNPSPVQQDEWELNQSWIYLTELDRNASNDKVDYWSNIDDVVFYMNYRYKNYKLSDIYDDGSDSLKNRINPSATRKDTSEQRTYKDLLRQIWHGLNDDPQKLETMKDLYTNEQATTYYLGEKALKEYEELLKQSDELGRYMAYQELENPFYSSAEDGHDSPLLITRRFGYDPKDKMYNGTVMQISQGQSLRAAFGGKIKIKGNDVLITSSSRELTYKKVNGIRVKDGEQVSAGQELGTVSSQGGQEFFYRKYRRYGDKDKKDEWIWVNPGFYFEKVKYNQTTSVLSNIEFSGDVAQRVQQTYKLLKQYKPNITKNGAAAIMGNFLTESNITSKRAEGDYLNPPIGASDGSWDDEAWLSMSGPSIYGGGYDNILRRGLGLGQWTDTKDGSTRHTLLLDFAKNKNKKWHNLELQIQFMFEGDSPYYIETVNRISESNDDVAKLTKEFLVYWEGNPGDKLLQRQDSAKQVLSYLEGGGSGGASFVKPNGKYAPIFNTDYWVMQPYGFTPWSSGAGGGLYGPSGGKHTGVDLAPLSVQYGTAALPADIPVYSITNGKVYNTGFSAVGGYQITIIPEGTDQYLYYGHLKEQPNLAPGTEVKAGQQIALLGNSGMTTIYHVHLEISPTPAIGTAASPDPSFLITGGSPLVQSQQIKVNQ